MGARRGARHPQVAAENVFSISERIVHENYVRERAPDHGEDIALVRLAQPWVGPTGRLVIIDVNAAGIATQASTLRADVLHRAGALQGLCPRALGDGHFMNILQQIGSLLATQRSTQGPRRPALAVADQEYEIVP